nr:cathelicidin-3-like [Rhipicephalus microplus]
MKAIVSIAVALTLVAQCGFAQCGPCTVPFICPLKTEKDSPPVITFPLETLSSRQRHWPNPPSPFPEPGPNPLPNPLPLSWPFPGPWLRPEPIQYTVQGS